MFLHFLPKVPAEPLLLPVIHSQQTFHVITLIGVSNLLEPCPNCFNFKYLDTYIVNGIKNPINLQRLNWGFPFSETEILNKKLEENYGKFINQEFLRNLEEYTFVINFYKRLQKQNLIIFY